jgi:hypothetical protein
MTATGRALNAIGLRLLVTGRDLTRRPYAATLATESLNLDRLKHRINRKA